MTMQMKRNRAGDFITIYSLESCPLRQDLPQDSREGMTCLHPMNDEVCSLKDCPLVDAPLAFRLSKGLIDDARKTDEGPDSGVVHPKVHLDGPGSVSD